jgi:AbrB family looped-hinge helix DNA binding protein
MQTKLSSRGQVVIPLQVRRRMGLAKGQTLDVTFDEHERKIVLRAGYSPAETDEILRKAIEWEKTNPVDPVEALHESRRKARIRERERRDS